MQKQTDEATAVALLADEFATRLREGDGPTIAEYANKYPELASAISDLFPAVAAMEHLRVREGAARRDAQSVQSPERRPDYFGDYRIVREIGRGGMGVVYEAEQQSLRRRVALKVLASSSVLSPKQVERFQREAKAAARLHHTNIVPVFGTGEQNGLHYYVMQFIRGVGLDEVINELSQLCSPESVPLSEVLSHVAPPPPSAARIAAGALRDGSLRRWQQPSSSSDIPASQKSVHSESTVVPSNNGQTRSGGARATSAKAIATNGQAGLGTPYWRCVARVGVQLSGALQYAHRQGILHRDIKPSNLLLDGGGTVWITDFGLAKCDEHEGVTNTGDIVGTLRYMAPEQYNGHTDARSDIYSLGLTLYELLTLRPAFAETQHGPLIQRKTQGSPAAPRSINRAIPRDLETITLKACATDAAHRYQSGDELAADLLRFLEDRPILARRVSPIERTWRWARRNPATAALSGIALVLLVTVAVVSAVANYRTTRLLGRVEEERLKAVTAAGDAQREFARAETNLQTALRAFENIIDNVADRGIPHSMELDYEEGQTPPNETVVTAADAELLRTLLAFFDQFAAQNRADLKAETASAHTRVGDIQQRLGRLEEAEEAYRQAIEIFKVLSERDPGNVQTVMAYADTLNNLAVALSKRGEMRSAREAHSDALHLLEQSDECLQRNTGKFQLATTLNLLGSVGSRVFPKMGDSMRRRDGGGDGFRMGRRPSGFTGRGGRFDSHAKPDDSQRALELLHELVESDPTHVDYRLALAQSYRNSGRRAHGRGETDQAEQSLCVAIDVLEQLVADHPHVPRFQYELADTLCIPAQGPDVESDGEAEARIQQGVVLCSRLIDQYPNIPEYRALTASSLIKLADLQRKAGRLEDAAQNYQTAIGYEQTLIKRFGTISLYHLVYAQSLRGMADVLQQQEDFVAARHNLETAIAHLERTFEGNSGSFAHRGILGRLYEDLSETLSSMGEFELADEYRAKSRRNREPFGAGFRRQAEGGERLPDRTAKPDAAD